MKSMENKENPVVQWKLRYGQKSGQKCSFSANNLRNIGATWNIGMIFSIENSNTTNIVECDKNAGFSYALGIWNSLCKWIYTYIETGSIRVVFLSRIWDSSIERPYVFPYGSINLVLLLGTLHNNPDFIFKK